MSGAGLAGIGQAQKAAQGLDLCRLVRFLVVGRLVQQLQEGAQMRLGADAQLYQVPDRVGLRLEAVRETKFFDGGLQLGRQRHLLAGRHRLGSADLAHVRSITRDNEFVYQKLIDDGFVSILLSVSESRFGVDDVSTATDGLTREFAMPFDGSSHLHNPLRTVSSMMLAGVVVPPVSDGFPGRDAGFLAAAAEISHLLALPAPDVRQIDRLQQLDDWISFMPSAGMDGATVKLARLLCPVEGLFSGRGLRLNGADEAALRDVARVLAAAKCSRVNDLGRGA